MQKLKAGTRKSLDLDIGHRIEALPQFVEGLDSYDADRTDHESECDKAYHRPGGKAMPGTMGGVPVARFAHISRPRRHRASQRHLYRSLEPPGEFVNLTVLPGHWRSTQARS